MDYLFENLSPERFEQFCHALLSHQFLKIQCFPVGQPDGGRDAIAFYKSENATEFIVFQVKFVRRPHTIIDPHKWLVEKLEEEVPKIQRLIPKGAKEYYLLTNVPGTAHPDTGSIDKVQTILDTLKIPSYCWWRDDLNGKLDGIWDLKWTYPEILTGVDMLRHVIESRLSENAERRTAAIRAFVRDQYENDKEVRFKQVELQNHLLDLFIDVPVVLRDTYNNKRQRFLPRKLLHRPTSAGHRGLIQRNRFDEEESFIGAATSLLHPNIYEHFPQIVLEGAPGQGKSTIAQYVCQIHRMRVLGEDDAIRIIPEEHKSTALRIPFKVDLRDLAAWLNRQNPFSPENTDELPVGWHKSLVAFLAAQVRHHSGGFDFSVADLHSVAKVSAILLVLDGFDEVADILTRQEIVKEVKRGINNLRESVISLQVVITSRPAAFANSPGFSDEEFPHFELVSITKGLIISYADKWIKAKRIQGRLSTEIRKTLKEKLDQPHLRDLARNPMQLAILLSLIHTRGSSLPEKRTALYDKYVELFFNREAEKNEVVREYRDLLIDIHRYLAWVLHSEAETGKDRGRGSVSEERLHKLLVDYLRTEGRDPSIAQKLFTGMIERVVVLVSRVQGTYEFEVQPLREYFAARHLFETAPYSPPGAEKRGTRPDRFDAISRNFYWLNVTRFFSGCYSKGELPSLVDRISELIGEEGYRHINHPRILAAILLSDWVFAQHQKSMEEIITIVLDGLGLRYALRGEVSYRSASNPLVLPKDSGRDELVQRCFEILATFPPLDYAIELIELIEANSNRGEIINIWYQQTIDADPDVRSRWIEYGLYLGLLSMLEQNQLDRLIVDDPNHCQSLGFIFRAKRLEFCESSKERVAILIDAILDRNITVHRQWRPSAILDWFAQVYDPQGYVEIFHTPSMVSLAEARKMSFHYLHLEHVEAEPSLELLNQKPSHNALVKCIELIKTVQEESEKPAKIWTTELTPWDNIVEKSRSIFGERWAHFHLANISSGIKSHTETCKDFPNLFDHSRSLCRRARYARLRAGQPNWWKSQFETAESIYDEMFASLVLLTWASPNTLIDISDLLNNVLSGLSDEKWKQLVSSLGQTMSLLFDKETSKRFDTRKLPANLSERTAITIALRLNDKLFVELYERFLTNYQGDDPVVLEYCQKAAAQKVLMGDIVDWEHYKSVIERSYSLGVVTDIYDFRWLIQSRPTSLPLEIAKQVTEHANRYPNYLVAMAEEKCREEVASRIVPVIEIAKKEGWFSF